MAQDCTLSDGEYKLTFLMNYVCPNEMRKTGNRISATDNDCYSLCGVSFGDTELFVYPTTAHNWEEMVIPFTLDAATTVRVSLGLRSTAQMGAANNARIYLDNIRLWRKKGEDIPDGVAVMAEDGTSGRVDVCTLSGVTLRRGVSESTAIAGLPQGVYIVGHRKVCVK